MIRHAREVRQTLISGLRCGCPNLHACIDCVLKPCAERHYRSEKLLEP
jgi:hypothetical protein